MTFFPAKASEPYCVPVKDLSSFIAMTCLSDNDTPVQPQLERSERARNGYGVHKNYAEVELLWAMTNAVELLRKRLWKGGMCYC